MESSKKGLSSLSILFILLVVLVAGGLVYFVSNRRAATVTSPSGQSVNEVSPTSEPSVVAPTNEATSETQKKVKEFTVSGTTFAFSPKELRVNKGDTVRVVFENKAGIHDFVLDEFTVRTKVLNAGAKETVEFVANKAGTFEYYCSVGNHRQMGMVGNLIVE